MVYNGLATLNVTSCSNKNEQHHDVRDNLVRNYDRSTTQAHIIEVYMLCNTKFLDKGPPANPLQPSIFN